MAEQLFGRATIYIAGQAVDSMRGATLDVGGEIRETVVTAKNVAGYTVHTKQSRVECSVPLSGGMSLSTFDTIGSLSFMTDDGLIFTISSAWRVDSITTGDQDGLIRLSFEGTPAEQH